MDASTKRSMILQGHQVQGCLSQLQGNDQDLGPGLAVRNQMGGKVCLFHPQLQAQAGPLTVLKAAQGSATALRATWQVPAYRRTRKA